MVTEGAKTPTEHLSLFLDDTMLTFVSVYTNDKIASLRNKLVT